MLPKFYVVKDEKDLLSGKIIPRKILNYLPLGFGMMNPVMSPVILPGHINKATSLTISPSSPFNISPFLSSGTGNYSSPNLYGSVEYKRIPLVPSCGPLVPSCSRGSPLVLGPPIIKTSGMISQNIFGTVKIIVGNYVYSISVPPSHIRNIANEINQYATMAYSTGPYAQFRLISPSIDWSARISYKHMFAFIGSINQRYYGLTYKLDDRDIIFSDLYGHIRNAFGHGYIPI